jgi:hypothetical protein
MNNSTYAREHICLMVDVFMRKERIDGPMSRWQPWRWVLDAVLVSEQAPPSELDLKRWLPNDLPAPQCVDQSDEGARWCFPGFPVVLFRDDAEGYFLNGTTPDPCWFVMWRMEEEACLADEPVARPQAVSLSYHDAGRWLDSQETVEQLPAPATVIEEMMAFAQAHYTPEPKKRLRPDSFVPLTDRFGQPAKVTTGKMRGGGSNG